MEIVNTFLKIFSKSIEREKNERTDEEEEEKAKKRFGGEGGGEKKRKERTKLEICLGE